MFIRSYFRLTALVIRSTSKLATHGVFERRRLELERVAYYAGLWQRRPARHRVKKAGPWQLQHLV